MDSLSVSKGTLYILLDKTRKVAEEISVDIYLLLQLYYIVLHVVTRKQDPV
jgi:hypothetical protein